MTPIEIQEVVYHSKKFIIFFKEKGKPDHLFKRIYDLSNSGEYVSQGLFYGYYDASTDDYWFKEYGNFEHRFAEPNELSKLYDLDSNLYAKHAEILIPLK